MAGFMAIIILDDHDCGPSLMAYHATAIQADLVRPGEPVAVEWPIVWLKRSWKNARDKQTKCAKGLQYCKSFSQAV